MEHFRIPLKTKLHVDVFFSNEISNLKLIHSQLSFNLEKSSNANAVLLAYYLEIYIHIIYNRFLKARTSSFVSKLAIDSGVNCSAFEGIQENNVFQEIGTLITMLFLHESSRTTLIKGL